MAETREPARRAPDAPLVCGGQGHDEDDVTFAAYLVLGCLGVTGLLCVGGILWWALA